MFIFHAAPATTDVSRFKRSGFTRNIISRVSTPLFTLLLPTSRFPVFRLPTLLFPTTFSGPRKVINGNCERGCKVKYIPNKSSLSGWRGVPLHKRVRVHNNFKSEYSLLEKKVSMFLPSKKQIYNSNRQ